MAGGVFYREFTKIMSFTGTNALGKVHVHLLVLGTFVHLIAALFSKQIDFEKEKSFVEKYEIKNRLQWFYSIWFKLLDVISMDVLSPLIAMLKYCCNVTRNIEIRILNISFLVNIDF